MSGERRRVRRRCGLRRRTTLVNLILGDHRMSISSSNSWSGIDLCRVRNCLLAAFDAGCLFNQFGWHLEHAAVLLSQDHKETMERIGADLAGKAIEACPSVISGMNIRDEILATCEGWKEKLRSEEFHEELGSAIDVLKELAKTYAPLNFFSSDVEQNLMGIIDKTDYARHTIRKMYEGEMRPFFELWQAFILGETVDQGLHPPRVSSHLWVQQENPDWCSPGPEQAHRESGAAPSRYVAIRKPRRSGELIPPPGWIPSIEALWTRFGVTSDLPEDLSRMTRRLSMRKRSEVVDQLHAGFRVALGELATSLIRECRAAPNVQCRLNVNIAEGFATLDGGAPQHVGRQGALYLDILIRARGNWKSSTEVGRENVELSSHLERIRNGLPSNILDLIETTHVGSRIPLERIYPGESVG
jgi:hypothetical protein